MKDARQIEETRSIRITESIAYVAGGTALIVALVETAFLTLPALILLLIACATAVIASGYDISIPRTRIQVRPRDLVTLCAIVWLGGPGAILVSVAGQLSLFRDRDREPRWTLLFVSEVLVALLSSIIFLGIFSLLNRSISASSTGFFGVPLDTTIAALLAGISLGANRLLRWRITDSDEKSSEGIMAVFGSTLAGQIILVCGTLLVVFSFQHFGIEFAFVVLPLILAAHFSFVVHNRRLESKTKEISGASRLHLSTVEALATAIDARDQVGMGHVRRTQIYAVGLGKAFGLSSAELDALRMGALLHDVGKLAVPDHILNKPGRLTQAEFEKTKIHASVGASILESIDFPYPVVPTVRHHHEQWDGTGYPDGLLGESIPLTARILSVADVYDTLRGARPYRDAIEAGKVLDLLRSDAGKRFDPNVISTFIKILPELNAEVKSQGLGYEVSNDSGAFVVTNTEFDGNQNFVQQIKRANREVFTLYSLAKEFGATADLNDSLRLFTSKIRDLAPYDTCVVYLLDKAGAVASARHVAGTNREELMGTTITPGEGATGYALRSRQCVQNVDPALDFAFTDWEFSRDYIGMASIPLLSDDELVGAVSLYSRSVACYSDEHIRLLETIARIATDSILRSQQLEEAENFALTDPMTGLPNSRGLENQFEKEAKRADRNNTSFQMLVLDLDGFKAINDTHGHKVGDLMLREIGSVIMGQLREYDFLARYGGDEFVAIVPATETIDVLELSRRIERAVGEFSLEVDGTNISGLGVSIGSASFPAQGETFDQLIVAADKAMYLTKAIHRQERENERRPRPADPPKPMVLRGSPQQIPKDISGPSEFADEIELIDGIDAEIVESNAVN